MARYGLKETRNELVSERERERSTRESVGNVEGSTSPDGGLPGSGGKLRWPDDGELIRHDVELTWPDGGLTRPNGILRRPGVKERGQ
jgi:hypothetical protein